MVKKIFYLFLCTSFLLSCGGKKSNTQTPNEEVVLNADEASIDQLNMMLEKEPNNPEYLYYRGLKYMDQEDYTQAIVDFDKSIAIDSTTAVTWFNRGTSKFSLDDFDGALIDYNKAIALKPEYYDAYYNRGVLFDTKQDYESACKDYTKVIELKPDYLDAIYYRGVDYLMLKKNDLACDDFKKLADQNYEDGKDAYQKYCIGKK